MIILFAICVKIAYICGPKPDYLMLINEKLPKYLLGKYQLIGTVTFSVLFAVVFLNIYIPFSETAWFELGNSDMFLHTLAFIAVSIMILICSRMLMYRTKTFYEMTYLGYTVWRRIFSLLEDSWLRNARSKRNAGCAMLR